MGQFSPLSACSTRITSAPRSAGRGKTNLPMVESGLMHYAKYLVKKVCVSRCFNTAIFRRSVSAVMRSPAKKFLMFLLALAIACLPLQAFACKMNPGQAMDHAAMDMTHMDHGDGASASCCDPQDTNSSGDCAGSMHCGACAAGTSMISPLPQLALVCLQTTALDSGSGEILPSHSSPPYHPPAS